MFHIDVGQAAPVAAARTWPSVYQLLPCPWQDPAARPIYDSPAPGLSQSHLAAAAQLHQDLDAMPATDAMSYIAGSLVPTLDGGAGETLEGDGVVSHRLGFLQGARTFVVPGDHVGLVANALVLSAVTPLLNDGSKGLLREVSVPS
jgi:hypothetical protein